MTTLSMDHETVETLSACSLCKNGCAPSGDPLGNTETAEQGTTVILRVSYSKRFHSEGVINLSRVKSILP